VRLVWEVREEVVSIAKEAEAVARRDGQRARDGSGLPKASWAWFAGLGVVAALRVVQPETALLLAVAHLVERHVHNQELDQFVAGLGEGI
jgi:hypothetical protein